MVSSSAEDVVPVDADLPGTGWLAIDEGFAASDGEGAAELFDCVGDEFPDDAVVATAASPHFVRPPRRLLHGVGVAFGSDDAGEVAGRILSSTDFAECLGRSVAADLELGPVEAELLAIDVIRTDDGHRVSFTGGDSEGVRPVHLDIAVVRRGRLVGLLWCGDTPEPFPAGDLNHVLHRIRRRTDPPHISAN